MNYPFYIINNNDEWIVLTSPLKRDIKHVTLWEILVAKMVAKINGLEYSDIKNLPYCQLRGRVVDNNLYYGDNFSPAQKIAIKNTLGDLNYIYDEHEKMSEYDVEVLNLALRSRLKNNT